MLQPRLDALLVYVEAASVPWMLSRRKQYGLYCLAQFAVDAGRSVQVDTLSANDKVIQRLERWLEARQCKTLGFYVDHDNMWALRDIIATLTLRNPSLRVLVGGPQVTCAPVQVLEHLPGLLCGVIGEGEETFVELLNMLDTPSPTLADCRGIAYMDGGRLVFTPSRGPLEPLDRLNIPRRRELTIEDDGEYQAALITGRGCVGRCAFCVEGRRRGREASPLRLHSVARCLAEVEYLVQEFDPGYITVMDDSLVAVPERVRDFCHGLLERYHGDLKWYCEARVDTLVRNEDLLPLMIEAGLIRLQLGGESGSQLILDAYRKGTTVEQLRQVARRTKEYGLLSCYVNFIIGGAFETVETYRMTRDLAVELLETSPGCVGVGYSFFTPYPSTPMHDNPARYGLRVADFAAVTGFGDSHVFCATEALSRFEILALGPDFESHVKQAMQRLAAGLPRPAIRKIFEARHRWDVETEWYDILSQDPVLFSYYHSLCEGTAVDFDTAMQRGIGAHAPIRTVDLKSSTDNCLLVKCARGAVVQLDDIDSVLLELLAGKLTFREIVEIISDQLPGVDQAPIRETLLLRLAHLDEHCAVVWQARGSWATSRS